MNVRLQQFLSAENITQAQLADALDVARAGVSHILAGRNKPSYDFLSALMVRFPRLNIEWLMFGKGKMYKDSDKKPSEQLFSDPEPEDIHEELLFMPEREPEQTNYTSSQSNSAQHIEKQRTIKKVIILFDDDTYQEM